MNGEVRTALLKLVVRLRTRARSAGRPGFYDSDADLAKSAAVQEALEEVADIVEGLLTEDDT